VHWFALAASVVVVAAAVLQIPRAGQGAAEIELPATTTPAQAPAQTEDKNGKLAGQVTTVNGSLAAKAESGAAESDDFQAQSRSTAAKPEAKRDEAPPVLLDGDSRENKQQARAQQSAVAPRRDGDLQTGAGGGGRRAASVGVAGGTSGGMMGGIAQSRAAGPGSSRVDAPAAPPPATPVASQAPAKSTEENQLAGGEAGRPKDAESEKSELAGTGDEGRQQAAGKSGYKFETEASGQPADQDALAADEKSRRVAAAAEPAYEQPKELPMKKHPEQQATAAASESSVAGRPGGFVDRKLKALLRWTISSAGKIIRSLDGGQSWQDVAVAEGVRFRAIAAQDGTVWAGGDGGALFHSADGGNTWTRRSLSTAGGLLKRAPGPPASTPAPSAGFDIVRIDVSAAGRVTVTTSQRKSFVSIDAGRSWKEQ
jgi:hypothetical protein